MHFFKDGKTVLIAMCKIQYSKINIRVTKMQSFSGTSNKKLYAILDFIFYL